MTDPDFDRLKQTPPSPRPEARRAALDAAMAAFDSAHKAAAHEDSEQDFDAAPQGKIEPIRLSERSHQTKGRSPMSHAIKTRYMIAASLVVLAATPVVMRAFNDGTPQKFSTVAGRIDTERSTQVSNAPPPPAAQPRVAESDLRARTDTPAPNRPGSAQQVARMEAPAPAPLAIHKGKAEADKRIDESSRLTSSSNLVHDQVRASAPAVGGLVAAAPPSDVRQQEVREYRDKFDHAEQNPIKSVAAEPVSTFSIDVDTASYAFARRALMHGHLPPKDSVRVEEMINYFPYSYPAPETADPPFKPSVTITPSPWAPGNQLVHIGIKGYELKSAERPRANLVFLIDVSGSMMPADRLPMVKTAFRMLVDELQPQDRVAIVTYASGSGVALPPTSITEKGAILAAIDRLGAGGSTAGAQGIQDAYRLAEENFDKTGVNRIILATDGDFNVGVTNQNALKDLVEREREKGVYLSILGVGQDNYNDALMQTLAQNGNGVAAYADTLNEARKVLVDQASAMLFPIANDVKIQMEWNPARVSEYRLIGYETRALRREDFNNDKVDAGDIGSGHTVTAIYEITPKDAASKSVDDLRYDSKTSRREEASAANDKVREVGFLKMRYKIPGAKESKLLQTPIDDSLVRTRIADAPQDVRFSIAVAGFGQLLTGGRHVGTFGYDDVIALAQGARGDDRFGYRAEFLNLARLAKSAAR